MGLKYSPLKPKYKKWKERHYPGRPILVLTGAMKEASEGGAGSVTEITKTTVKFGVDIDQIEYARIHQLGGSTGKAFIPQRPYLWSADGGLPGRGIQKLKDLLEKSLETD